MSDNVILIVAIILIVGLAGFYIYKSKKSGKKCIGCPDGCSCNEHGNFCNCNNENQDNSIIK